MSCRKYGALAVFVLQNAGVILLMRYSKVSGAGVSYNSAVAVLMQELSKLPVCMVLHAVERGGPCQFISGVAADLHQNWGEWLQLLVPALLYTVQNNALFLGLANLEAAVAQVTYQGKIFTTAFFSVCLLGTRLRAIQWAALALLALGVLCVQGLPTRIADRTLAHGGNNSVVAVEDNEATAHATLVGVCAMLVACVCSSFAGGAPGWA